MDCLNITVNESDQFINRLKQQDENILQFFDYDRLKRKVMHAVCNNLTMVENMKWRKLCARIWRI